MDGVGIKTLFMRTNVIGSAAVSRPGVCLFIYSFIPLANEHVNHLELISTRGICVCNLMLLILNTKSKEL